MPQAEMKEYSVLETTVLSYPDKAKQLTIKTPYDYTVAGEFVKAIGALKKEVEESFRPQILQAHNLHKSLIREMDRHLEPLQIASLTVRRLMISWDAHQELLRREEELLLQELARKAEEEAQLAAALEAEANGQKEEAEAIMDEPVYVPPIIVKKDVPKVAGVVFRTIWKWRLNDIKKVPDDYKILDEVKIGAVVRARKQVGEVIPGIEAYSEKQ